MTRRAAPTAAELIPLHVGLDELRERAARCTACPLHANATQTVFGEGPAHAALMLIGETPGDQEDRQGRPFVGPAGRLLDHCLAEAGIERARAYVSNVVKHFKWTPRGKRRMHSKPNAMEIRACRPWLDAEIAAVRPKVLMCLGATAARALLGSDFSVTQSRGKLIKSDIAPHVMATVHPSAILRVPQDEDRQAETARFIEDLRKVAQLM